MKKILDTSVWIEFFAERSRLSKESLNWLGNQIREDRVVIIQPIRAELLSGNILKRLQEQIERTFSAVATVDLDWRDLANGEVVISFAHTARKKGLAIPGLIDRMIILSALKSGSELCSSDKALARLAHALGVGVREI